MTLGFVSLRDPPPVEPLPSERARPTDDAGGRRLCLIEHAKPALQFILSYLDLRDKARCKSVHSVYARTLMGRGWRADLDPSRPVPPLLPAALMRAMDLEVLDAARANPLVMRAILGDAWRARVEAAQGGVRAASAKRQRSARVYDAEVNEFAASLVHCLSENDVVVVSTTGVTFPSIPRRVRADPRKPNQALGPLTLPMSAFGGLRVGVQKVVTTGDSRLAMLRAIRAFTPVVWERSDPRGTDQAGLAHIVRCSRVDAAAPIDRLREVVSVRIDQTPRGPIQLAETVEVSSAVDDVPAVARLVAPVVVRFIMTPSDHEDHITAPWPRMERPVLQRLDLGGFSRVRHLCLSSEQYWSIEAENLSVCCPALVTAEVFRPSEWGAWFVDRRKIARLRLQRVTGPGRPRNILFRTALHDVDEMAALSPFFSAATRIKLVLAHGDLVGADKPEQNAWFLRWFGTRTTDVDLVIFTPCAANARFIAHLLGLRGARDLVERNGRYFELRVPSAPLERAPLTGEARVLTYRGVRGSSLARDL